ncbi:cytochrome c3 family protein [Desulfurivibrio dismutans]|uniref:cytochrome c3 family protein n=1 Tax=Desulfurivibrio dismutans TaxID=1398908 RepID=UPI0023DC4CC5|nr:cytochrome c3 family protein [Desulfurivibrio alkaliphilus]MDF1613738.1 cytochrome c3 family protein [Desulfurivibrio alkaliphilus]
MPSLKIIFSACLPAVCGWLLIFTVAGPSPVAAQQDYQFTFDHEQHRYLVFPGSPCITCHLPDTPTITPERRACLQCHDQEFTEMVKFPGMVNTHGPLWGFNHGPLAKNRQLDCAGCHQQNYCLNCHAQGPAQEMGKFGGSLLNVHRSDFRVSHPLAARTNPRLCASCHEPASCNECHSDFRRRGDLRPGSPSHRRTFDLGMDGDIAAIHEDFRGPGALARCDDCHRSDTVAPSMHSWGQDHAREARRNLQTCQACHPGGDTCMQCHSAKSGPGGISPHGSDWSSTRADRLRKASGGATCGRCH